MLSSPRTLLRLLPLAALLASCQSTVKVDPNQPKFATPGEGFHTMVEALKAHDLPKAETILGLKVAEILSGDPVSDRLDRQNVVRFAAQGTRVREVTDSAAWVDCGPDNWTFPVPLIKQSDGSWRFDGPWGREEIRNRIVGRNELSTLETLRVLLAAQKEYHKMDPDKDGVKSFATRIFSTEGQRNGLYWPPAAGAPKSPASRLKASADAEGYADLATGKVPFHGYHYRVLHAQGKHVSGGAKSYFDANGRLTGGFALIAWPADYGRSGAMTFLVTGQGRVFEKDLGKGTARKAPRITVFNPDDSWMAVESL